MKVDIRALLKAVKCTLLVPPQGVDNTVFAGNTYIDTQGLGSVLFLLSAGSLAAAIGSTAATTPPLVEECDTSGGSYTAVTGAALAAVISATDDDKMYGIHVDLSKSHKRYMRVQAPTAGDGSASESFLAITAIGFPADVSPADAAGMGLAEIIEA